MTVLRHPNNQGVTLTQWRKTASGGETSLSGTDDFGAGLAYTAGAEQVFVNGVLIERGVDYTASTGTTVTGLTALVAGDIVTVSSPSAFNVANAIPKATVAAKGDLIVGNGAASVTNLAVGADGTTLVANSSASTGVSWAGPVQVAAKNLLINGLLDIWQRSTSVTGQANGYSTVDRWYLVSTASCTFAQESTVVPNGCRYSQKVTVGASSSSTQAYQAVETSNAVAFAGQNIAFSAYFQSSATPTINLVVEYSTTVDYPLASGSWVAISATSGGSGTAGSASFTRVSGVYAIPSTAKSLRFSFNSSTMASGAVLYYGGFQAELGSVVTSLMRNASTLQGELAACQRYYYRNTNPAYAYGYIAPWGSATSTTQIVTNISVPVSLRITPTAVDYANLAVTADDGTVIAISAATMGNGSLNVVPVKLTGTGFTQYRPYGPIGNNSTNAYIGFSAEL